MDFNTGTGGTRDPGGSPSGPSGPPPRTSGVAAGGEFDYRDPVQSFVTTVQRVVLQPVDFYRGLQHRGDFLNPLIFSIICYEVYALLGGLIGLVFGSVASIGPGSAGQQAAGVATSIGGFLLSIILAPIWAALILFVMAGLRYLLVILIIGQQNAGFEATMRVQAYTFATRIIWWIPILGPLVGFVYGLYLSVVGIREVHATTTGKAALVALIPVVVLLLFLALLAALFGALIWTVLQQQA